MSAPATFASTEVALHRMREHFPCRGEDDAVVLYECPCGVTTIYTCAACGECLTVSFEGKQACEHSRALDRATGQFQRTARVIDGELWVNADIGIGE